MATLRTKPALFKGPVAKVWKMFTQLDACEGGCTPQSMLAWYQIHGMPQNRWAQTTDLLQHCAQTKKSWKVRNKKD